LREGQLNKRRKLDIALGVKLPNTILLRIDKAME
jgi:hypothetical protein